MKDRRKEKTAELIKHLAAEFIARESGGQSLITVTDVSLSSDGKYATIFFTAYPEEKEQAALDFAKRRIADFREHIEDNARIGKLPFFEWKIDLGEKNRQKIERLSEKK